MPEKLIVQKFGGTSVADPARIKNVARRVSEHYKRGYQCVVVLSAQGDTTDDLIAKARELAENPSKRELDMLMATGEQISVALLAMALIDTGYNAISLNAFQAGLVCTSVYNNAKFKSIDTERIKFELERNNIVIVTGFQAINKYGDVSTLGRGGSDTSAVALAAALHADLCEIYTDVDGIYTADPRIVKNARKLDVITYDEMLELATLGAKVLHNRSVELAKKYNVKLTVRSSLNAHEGTLVKEDTKVESMMITGIAADPDIAVISLIGLKNEPGKAFKLFTMLAKEKISVDIILQSIGRNDTKDITFTVAKKDADATKEVIESNADVLKYGSFNINPGLAKLSVVGTGMETHPGVASKMFEALFDKNINIGMISTSEIKISVLIDAADLDKGVNAIHEKFFDDVGRGV